MDEQKKYILNRLSELLRVDIFCQSGEKLISYQRFFGINPIFNSKQLREKLAKGADEQDLPLLYKEDSIYFICVKSEKKYYFAGPLSLGALNRVELHKYYKRYGIRTEKEKALKRFQFSEMMDIAELLDGILNKNMIEDVELAKANHLTAGEEEPEQQEKIIYELKADEEAEYHHTYQEERQLLDCVREGRVEDALHFTRTMDRNVSVETGIPVEELNGEKAFSLANQGNEKALAGIRNHAKKLAIHIHNCQYMFDPEKIAVGGGISEQPLLLQLIREELAKINGMYPWTLPVPEVTSCRFYNDANLIGAVYVHMKAKEKKISLDKVNELMELLENRREGEYLRALLTE